jgi:hypothetical protein
MSKILACNNVGDTSTIEIEDSNGDKYVIVFIGNDSDLNPNKGVSPCLCLINENRFKLPKPKFDEPFEWWNTRLYNVFPYDNNKVYQIKKEEEEDK